MANEPIIGTTGNPLPQQVRAEDVPLATNGLSTPTIYADVIRGAAILGEMAKINLVEIRIDAQTMNPAAVHVATLVIPATQVAQWGTYFTELAQKITGSEDKPVSHV